jgi:hypothetical protein
MNPSALNPSLLSPSAQTDLYSLMGGSRLASNPSQLTRYSPSAGSLLRRNQLNQLNRLTVIGTVVLQVAQLPLPALLALIQRLPQVSYLRGKSQQQLNQWTSTEFPKRCVAQSGYNLQTVTDTRFAVHLTETWQLPKMEARHIRLKIHAGCKIRDSENLEYCQNCMSQALHLNP